MHMLGSNDAQHAARRARDQRRRHAAEAPGKRASADSEMRCSGTLSEHSRTDGQLDE
jgi:hypothetical protein